MLEKRLEQQRTLFSLTGVQPLLSVSIDLFTHPPGPARLGTESGWDQQFALLISILTLAVLVDNYATYQTHPLCQ